MKEMNRLVNVMFVTAFMDDESASEIAKEHRFVLYKPVDVERLISTIEIST